MEADEYLALIDDLVKDLEVKLAPLQEQMRAEILEAEKVYEQALNTEPEFLYKTYNMGDTGRSLAGYMYKWRDQDAEKALDKASNEAEEKYYLAAQPLVDEHEKRVQERLKCPPG